MLKTNRRKKKSFRFGEFKTMLIKPKGNNNRIKIEISPPGTDLHRIATHRVHWSTKSSIIQQ